MDGLSLNAMMNGFQNGGGSLGSTLASIYNTKTLSGQMDKNRDLIRDQGIMENSRLNRGLSIEQDKIDKAYTIDKQNADTEANRVKLAHELGVEQNKIRRLEAEAEVRGKDAVTAKKLQELRFANEDRLNQFNLNTAQFVQRHIEEYGDKAFDLPQVRSAITSIGTANGSEAINARTHADGNSVAVFEDLGDGRILAGLETADGVRKPLTQDQNTQYAEAASHEDARVLTTDYKTMWYNIEGELSSKMKNGQTDFNAFQTVAANNAAVKAGLVKTGQQAAAAHSAAHLTGKNNTGLSLLKGEAYTDQGKEEEEIRNAALKAKATTPPDELAQQEQKAFVTNNATNNMKAAVMDEKAENQLQLALTRIQRKNDRWFDDIRDLWDSNDPLENYTVKDVKNALASMLNHDRSRKRLKETMPNPFKGDKPTTPEEWVRLLDWVSKNPRILGNWEEGKDTYGDAY